MLQRFVPLALGALMLLGLALHTPVTSQRGDFCSVELTLVGDGGIGLINNYFTTDLETTGDGKASPGEILHFRVKIKNTSGTRLISTSAVASCSERRCVLSMPTETSRNKRSRPGHMVLPEMAPGAEVVRDFWVGVPNNVSADGSMVVTVDVGDSDLGVVKQDLTIGMAPAAATAVFKAPVIENLKFDDDQFGDSDGNGDGLPQIDERIELRLDLRNGEEMPMSGVEVIVRSTYITFTESRKVFEQLPPASAGDAGLRMDFAGRVIGLPEQGKLPVEITVLGRLNNTDSSWTFNAMLSVSDRNTPPQLTSGVLESLAGFADPGSALHSLHLWARTFNVMGIDEYRSVLNGEAAALNRQGGNPAILADLEKALKDERDLMARSDADEAELAARRNSRQLFAMSAFSQRAQWGGIWSSPNYVRSVDPFGLEGMSETAQDAVGRKGLRWTPRTAQLLLATLYGNEGWQSIPTPKQLETHSYIKEVVAASLGAVVQANVLVRPGPDSTLVTVFIARGVGALGASSLKVMFLCSPDYEQCRLLFTHARDYAVRVSTP